MLKINDKIGLGWLAILAFLEELSQQKKYVKKFQDKFKKDFNESKTDDRYHDLLLAIKLIREFTNDSQLAYIFLLVGLNKDDIKLFIPQISDEDFEKGIKDLKLETLN